MGNSKSTAPSSFIDVRPHASRSSAVSSPDVRRLTEREHQVALLVAQGLKDTVIARRLGISASTVAGYVGHIKQRLKLASRAGIVAWATARLDPDDPAEGQRPADHGCAAKTRRDSHAS